ncbi:MAG: hypothetical protein ABJN40_21740 [Sneathiella sp.]
MSASYHQAYQTLLASRDELDSQDIAVLPREGQINLLRSQQAVYSEIQALMVRKMTERTDQFSAVTAEFRQSRQGFQAIQQWAEEASKTGEMVGGLLKGVSLALTLL